MMPRERTTFLCTEEAITGYSWSNQGKVSIEVCFGFMNINGTFNSSPIHAPENYVVEGEDYHELLEGKLDGQFDTDLLWKYVDKARETINNQRRITIHDSSNTQR